ncbi:sensor histidine kinase [Bowmanella dokdonensis]|uniref:histidine kinase n=1 Tax=Bowmanella dokdonensis TaxID=751969 RepID=A0A939DTE5_9ALTE|nr:HAMP domain-containing sensor histidine kinase [Bowmanella dokdonensis]MBN7827601.1 HAMP domain-containing histidine kinase [Bowmanella dokdonensis]
MRTAALATGLVALALVSARFTYLELFALRLNHFESEQNQLLTNAIVFFSGEIGYSRNLTKVLKHSEALEEALTSSQQGDFRPALAESFVRFARVTEVISQVRWLDPEGNEQVRVNVTANGGKVVSDEELQNKSGRYYFEEARKIQANEVYVSPIDLNVEHGQPVRPYQPTIRTLMRTGTDDRLRPGLLAINFDLTPLFSRLRALQTDSLDIELLDQQGFWLIAADSSKQWGRDLGRLQNNLEFFNPELWRQLQSRGADSLIARDRLWRYQRFPIDALQTWDGKDKESLYFLIATKPGLLGEIRQQTLSSVAVLGLGILLLGGLALRQLYAADLRGLRLNQILQREKQELKEAYESLHQALQRQQLLQNELVESRKLSSLGMMVAGVAHELNTPNGGALMSVTSVHQALSTLGQQVRQRLSKNELQHFMDYSEQGLALAEKNLNRMSKLIHSFKRLAVDRTDEDLHEFALAQLVEDLLISLKPKLKKTATKVETDIDAQIILISYPGYLSQVLQNLIDNAISHGFSGQSGGNIRISATQQNNSEVHLRISDDGVGIDPQKIDKIFDPFFTTGRQAGHSGLGLHLVNQWVGQFLQGYIKLDSTVSQGTTFNLYIAKVIAKD